MLYQVPRSLSGNQRDRLMTPGGAPIDWAQPLTPQMTAKTRNRRTPGKPGAPWKKPSAPMMKFTRAETSRPAAMKRRTLQ